MVREFIGKLALAWKMASTVDILKALYTQANSKSGAAVNWKTALEVSTVLACTRVVAQDLAQVPCKLMRASGGMREPMSESSLYYLLHDSPNEWMTAFEFWEAVGYHLMLCGNHFSFINRVRGEVYELLPYEPGQVTVKRDGWNLSYEVQDDGGNVFQIPAANMWHIRGGSWNTWMGLEPVKLARESIGLALATEEAGALLFKNGSQPSGLLSTDQQLSPDKAKEIRESWQESNGEGNRLKTAVVWGGMKWTAMSYPNDQMQYLETRKFQVEEICRALGVLPIMVGYSDKTATYASAEQMFIHHIVHTMGPVYARVEQSAKKNLLTPKERKEGQYIKFIVNGLMRGASKDRGEFYAKALGSGGSPAWMTQDEVRELEELNPMGGNAAILREPSNVGGKPDESREKGQSDETV